MKGKDADYEIMVMEAIGVATGAKSSDETLDFLPKIPQARGRPSVTTDQR